VQVYRVTNPVLAAIGRHAVTEAIPTTGASHDTRADNTIM